MSMKTKPFIAAIISIFLFILVAIAQDDNLALANFTIPKEIASPTSTVYTTNQIPISVKVELSAGYRFAYSMTINEMYYSLDLNANVSLSMYITETGTQKLKDATFRGYGSLSELTDGLHNLVIYAKGNFLPYVLGKVNFTVNTKNDFSAPYITIVSPQNTTYSKTEIPLTFSLNKTTSSITYKLDNSANTTVTGNTTLTNLSEGSHNLTMYASDNLGNIGDPKTVHFEIKLEPPIIQPTISMPKEYLNYTIFLFNAIPWAKVQGTYPIYYQNPQPTQPLLMIYPIPPETTNIQISLNSTQLNWSNYTQAFPDALHHTALGDWSMIKVNFNTSAFFILQIQYEHPIINENGTYQFLYDLNISPYLSPFNPNSTAYFNLKMADKWANLQVFTTPQDNEKNPLNFIVQKQPNTQEATFEVTSEYSQPLSGDLLVTFNGEVQAQDPPYLTVAAILVVAAGAGLGAISLKKKHR
jgi:hypothetical protein